MRMQKKLWKILNRNNLEREDKYFKLKTCTMKNRTLQKKYFCLVLVVMITVLIGTYTIQQKQNLESLEHCYIKIETAQNLYADTIVRKLDFYRGKKKVFSYACSEQETGIHFMGYSELDSGLPDVSTITLQRWSVDTNWRKALVDLKGDGDKRYLLIGESGFGNWVYGGLTVLDAKNNFQPLFTLDDGLTEYWHYYNKNPRLIFPESITWRYGGAARGGGVVLYFRFDKTPPELVSEKSPPMKILNEYRNEYRERGKTFRDPDYGKEIIIDQMLGALFSTGNAQKAQEYILLLGCTPEEYQRYFREFIRKIRDWKYFSQLCKFNGLDPVATY